MSTRSDLVYVLLFAIGWPLYEYFIDWPAFQRRLRKAPLSARLREYQVTIACQWLIVGVGVGLWLRANRSWSQLDLRAPTGIRLWIAAAVLVLLAAGYASQARKVARHERARAQVRKALASMEAILPHNGAEFTWFLIASATAGVCEEFLYRGFFNWALAPWLSWWGAAALSVPAFGLLHAYQGKKGIVRTGVVGAIMTLVVASTRSLLPAMALHSLIDVGAGTVTWIAFRDTQVGDQPRGDPASPART